jgi:hypothetical protein
LSIFLILVKICFEFSAVCVRGEVPSGATIGLA